MYVCINSVEDLCVYMHVCMHLKSVVARPLFTMPPVYICADRIGSCIIPQNHPTCYCSPSHVCLVLFSGIWWNKFIADFQVTNPSNEKLAVTDITGHYMDEGVP